MTTDDVLADTTPFSEDELAQARRYGVVIQWSPDDSVFIAEVPQLPGAKTHGATPAEAVELASDVAALWIRMAKQGNEPIPEPRALKAIA